MGTRAKLRLPTLRRGHRMEMIEVQSSNIARVGHEGLTARVEFKSRLGGISSIWEYEGMTESAFQRWMEADSIGSYFQAHVRGKYESRKVEE